MLTLGAVLYVALLLINATAVLSEDRFLARIGWTAAQPQNAGAASYQSYDQSSYGYVQQDIGVKVRIINLISAVRTLMRRLNLVVIVYELILGG